MQINASGLTSCAVVDWANLKFDDLSKLREGTCGAKHLKEFWAVTGTFIVTLFVTGGFRSIIDCISRKLFFEISGEHPKEAADGLEAGAYELHIIKTAHLGLCQAMGALLCVARYTGCPCGWLTQALWSMAVIWLIGVPVGAIVLMALAYKEGSRRGAIQFDRNPGSTWCAFFKKIGAVKSAKGAESFVNPRVVHGMFKFFLVSIHLLSGAREARMHVNSCPCTRVLSPNR